MRFHFVFNPVAGRYQTAALVEAVAERIRARGHEVTSYGTKAAGDGSRHVAGLAPDSLDRLIVVGGDGTLHDVVNARAAPLPWPVGIVPAGTANLVARELGIAPNLAPQRLADLLIRAQGWPVNLMEVEHQGQPPYYAVANVGVGIDARIVRTIADLRAGSAQSGGYLRWIQPIWRAIWKGGLRPLSVTVDGGRTWHASSCVVQNARSYGGVFRLAPEAALDAETLQVCLFRNRTPRDLLRMVAQGLAHTIHRARDIRILPARQVELRAHGQAATQVDGDPAGPANVRIRLCPGALTLLRSVPAPA
jgi:YegS/Rv2252/BmrU family lipid kinase